MKKKLKKILKATAAVAVAVIIIFSLVITFARDKNIPTWDNIFDYFGLRERLLPETAEDYVVFLDVGQGDCALIVSNGESALIDAGEAEYGHTVYNKLRRYGVNDIDFMLGSHNHSDHIGAFEYLLENLSVGNIMLNFKNVAQDAEKALPQSIATLSYGNKVNKYDPVRSAVINIGDFELTVIGFYSDATGENNRSVFVMAKIGEIKFLFTGDAEEQAENRLLKDNINIDCDVLKVSHHGSGTSSTVNFLGNASPQYAVISCGENNSYGHPNENVIERLKTIRATVYRTDIQGDIAFEVKDSELNVFMQN